MRELDAHILDARMDESVHVLLLPAPGEVLLRRGGHRHARKGESVLQVQLLLTANETLCRLSRRPSW